MILHPYDIVAELENRVAKYAGAPYAVAVDSCTNALTIALKYHFLNNYNGFEPKTVGLPCKTYVGVGYAILNAGAICEFTDYEWSGAYTLGNTNIIDSARRFRKNMYVPGSLYCLSAHWGKHLKIGRGGFILTDDEEAARIMRIMRFDGRTAGVDPRDDDFKYPGMHCYALPEEAARGLMLMTYMPDDNPDLPLDAYPDLSKYPIFRGE